MACRRRTPKLCCERSGKSSGDGWFDMVRMNER